MKILYVTTISDTVNSFLIPHIKLLVEQGHHVDVAFKIVQEVNSDLFELGCKVHNLEFQRSPLNKQNYLAYKKLKQLIRIEKYDLVHTHTPVASAIVRLVCRNINDIKVFYTAHGFHFFKGAPMKNWLIYYPLERWLAKYTDVLFTINKEDYRRAKKSFKAGKVEYIPGVGLDTKKFSEICVDRLTKRKELGLSEHDFVVLSVGELNKNKNHETVIRAIAKFEDPNIHYIIAGQGELKEYLLGVASQLGIQERVHLLGYRTDVAELYKVSDIFWFPSFREGLPVSLMEAMACGLPVICSNIRGNTDLISDGIGGYIFEPGDISDALRAMKLVLTNKNREKMSEANLGKVQEFNLEKVQKKMAAIY